jgi:serine/threonine-protein kinase
VQALLEVDPAPLGLGDLDTIVAKALRKDPRERYQTAAAFADDLRRFLRHEPVSARPDSLAYRARKFARRNRWSVAAAGSIALLAGAYVATVVVQSARVRSALAEARLGTHRAEQVTDYMLGLFKASEGGRLLTDTARSRELLDRGVVQARALAGQPELTAQMLDVIGRIETYLGRSDRAAPLLQEALATRRCCRRRSRRAAASTGRAMPMSPRASRAWPRRRATQQRSSSSGVRHWRCGAGSPPPRIQRRSMQSMTLRTRCTARATGWQPSRSLTSGSRPFRGGRAK